MAYALDIYVRADTEHNIDFSYEQLVEKPATGGSFLSIGAPAKEWTEVHNTYTPPMYIITLTPYQDIVHKAINLNMQRKDDLPALVEYDEVKLSKLAAVISERELITEPHMNGSIIIWEEYQDEDKRGFYPTADLDKIRIIIEQTIQEFKRTHSYSVISPGANCDQVWKSAEDFKRVLQ